MELKKTLKDTTYASALFVLSVVGLSIGKPNSLESGISYKDNQRETVDIEKITKEKEEFSRQYWENLPRENEGHKITEKQGRMLDQIAIKWVNDILPLPNRSHAIYKSALYPNGFDNCPYEIKQLQERYGLSNDFVKGLEIVLKNAKYPKAARQEYANKISDPNAIRVLKRNRTEQIVLVSGEASVYTNKECSNITATGGPVYDDFLNAAVNEEIGGERPFLGYVKNLKNNEGSYFIADNNGPYELIDGEYVPHSRRVIDLSPALAKQIGIYKGEKNGKPLGLGNVEIRYIEPLFEYKQYLE
ncbi:MAG: hypothetical protein AABX48_04370 [Nanoarchaeota archaeon]